MPAYFFSKKYSKKSIEIFEKYLTKCFLCGIIYMQSREAQRAKIKGENIMDQNKAMTEEMNSYVEKAFAAKKNCQKTLDAAHNQLPVIDGKSERQIKYAEDLREKWIKFHTGDIDRYFKVKEKCTPEKIKILADTKFDGETEKALDYVFDQYQIKTARLVFEETRASSIIDELK